MLFGIFNIIGDKRSYYHIATVYLHKPAKLHVSPDLYYTEFFHKPSTFLNILASGHSCSQCRGTEQIQTNMASKRKTSDALWSRSTAYSQCTCFPALLSWTYWLFLWTGSPEHFSFSKFDSKTVISHLSYIVPFVSDQHLSNAWHFGTRIHWIKWLEYESGQRNATK